MLMYATGLRISEVLHLRLCDIDSDRNEVYVNQGKGAKDRIVRVPSKLIDILRVYYKRYRPKEYLFEGQGGSVKYSESSIRKIINRARSKSKISMLHTFGSDMKYHFHVHCLITFGGLTSNGDWVYPNRKYKIARYRELSAVYKSLFLKGLRKMYDKGEIDYHISYEELTVAVKKKRWVVHNTRPTIDTKVLEEYLARYINRVAITNSRLQYVKAENEVRIIYNDYKSQIAGKAAPKKVRSLDPLVAIDQIMQHVLPPYFQKSRRYGLHSPITKKRLTPIMPEKIKRNGQTIRTLIEILTQLLKQKPYQCSKCGSTEYEIEEITGDRNWIHQYIALSNCRSPPMMPNISNGCRWK